MHKAPQSTPRPTPGVATTDGVRSFAPDTLCRSIESSASLDTEQIDAFVAHAVALFTSHLRTALYGRLLSPRALTPSELQSVPLDAQLLPIQDSIVASAGVSNANGSAIRLPTTLKTSEFAILIGETPESVRRRIRRKGIKAHGRPSKIPPRELVKFGVDLADAARLLHERSARRSQE